MFSIFTLLGGLRPIHLVIGAVVLLVASLGIQTWRLDHAKKELSQSRIGLFNCQASVQLQNAAIDDLKKKADSQQQLGRDALAVAQTQSRANQRLVSQILSAAPSEDKCKSADDLILGVVGGPGN